MKRISLRDHEQSQAITRLRSLQKIHDNMLDNMFDELCSKFHNKEMPDRFWDAIPSDLKNKYKGTISNIRTKIRDIISQYPEYYSQYRDKNKPYFNKVEKQRKDLLHSMDEAPLEEESLVNVGI